VDRLTSGRLKLDDVNEGFDRLHECKAVRQVVVLLEERRAMKVTVEIDCTPIEARQFFTM
jgi:alcohol dehydrogenase